MTTDLEKQFFDTFGIEPKTNQVYGIQLDYHIEEYPQITDRILLELICIWNLYCTYTLIPTNYPKIKEYVLEQFLLIDTYNFIVDLPIVKQQVQALFKEQQ